MRELDGLQQSRYSHEAKLQDVKETARLISLTKMPHQEKENEDALKGKQADLGASIIKLGSSKYRLKVWNKGAATARNVRIEFPEGNDLVIESEVTDKFPMESLEKYQAVELIAAVHMQTKRKHVVRLVWEDDAQSYNEKLSYPTL